MYHTYGGVSVYYTVRGSGEKKLLLLHGWGADSRSLHSVACHYSAYYTVTALDFPPFGLSGQLDKDYTVSCYKDMVVSLLNYLKIGSADIICHSFGGRVAAKLAASCPERVKRIVFCASAGIPRKKTVKARVKKLFYKISKTLAAHKLLNADALKKFFSSDYNALPPDMQRTFVNVINENLTEDIKKINCPTLLIWGDKDKETPLETAKAFSGIIRGSALHIIKGCGHYVFLDDFKSFINITDSFLLPQENQT